eukprot:5664280-Pyramimonas_sp.AAC.1
MCGAQLPEERELLETIPVDDLYTAPTQMITDKSALVTVAEEQRGHLPTLGTPRAVDRTETFHAPVPVCSTDEDNTYG